MKNYYAALGSSRYEASVGEPESLFADTHAVHPSFEALSERLFRNFTGWHVPKAEKREPLSVEVMLTPEQARRGGVLAIAIPVYEVCGDCNGSGTDWPFLCRQCAGNGALMRRRQLEVDVPQLLRLGTTSELPLERFGIANLFLRLHFRVSRELVH